MEIALERLPMRPKPFAELADVELAELRLLASDIDDTLTATVKCFRKSSHSLETP
jgi:hypothetical protein